MITTSIIIPTYNRADSLKITLTSIAGLRALDGVEVIVVDNGSDDDTRGVVEEFLGKLPVQYHYDAEPGLLTGRHLGASLAKGEVLCFLDDDVELDPTWLVGVRDAFSDAKVQLATGPCLPKYNNTPPQWLPYFWKKVGGGSVCEWLSLIDLGNTLKIINPTSVWGLNFCIRKNALVALGGFHPDNLPPHLQIYQGDGETGLTLKACTVNYKSIYHPLIKVQHIISAERLTLVYFKKRAYYQGICNSFTEMRMQYLETRKENDVFRKVLDTIRLQLKNSITQLTQEADPGEIVEMKTTLATEEKRGYDFHQEAFKNNSIIRDWVLKENYWDYRLPL